MILAGAGTGKTRVITYRIAHMLKTGVPPASIVALSFTNKAAKEMTERVKHLVGDRAKDCWLGTFHSFCLAILRKFPREAALAPGFGLAGTSDQIDLVRKGLEEKNWQGTYQVDRMHYLIGVAKNHMLLPDDLRQGKGREVIKDDVTALAEVYDLYERQLKLNRVIDFDDCIFRTVRLLRADDSVRQRLRSQFKYLMVDEYQDTNGAQLAVLELLASDVHDVCVVGDDDQSIYSWRGAMYEVLEQFEQLFPKARIIKLEQNYRCSNIILGAANKVIKNNTRRKDKTLWSASEDQTPILLSPCEDDGAEARYVAEKCITLLGQGLQPQDIGVLYRANNQAKAIELALREARIHYKTYGGQSFFERKEVKDFVSYVRLILDQEDRLALWRVINTPNRGIGLKTLEKIEEIARLNDQTPFKVTQADGFADGAVGNFAAMIRELAALPLSSPADFEALGLAILKNTGLENDIRTKTDNPNIRDKKLANVRSLPKWLATLAEEVFEESGIVDFQAILDSLSLDNDRRDEKEKGKNHVSLMTIHAAKGLEFPAVFVVGVEEELLPHKNSIADPNALCEERRLFYVALTRAKQKLFLSYCLDRKGGYGGTQSRMPSRFLQELPKDSYARTDDEASRTKRADSEKDRKQKTASRLSAFRQTLNS